MGRYCKACGEPVAEGQYWCSDACWRAEDGGDDGPADDGWIARAYERQVPARREGYYDGGRLRY
jgi:hypothetical protein